MRRSSIRSAAILSVAACLIAICLLPFYQRQAGVLYPGRLVRIGVNQSPPYSIIAKDGSVSGLTVDIFDEIARRRGVKLEWVPAPEGPDEALPNRRVDLWPLLTDTPARKGRIFISKPYLLGHYSLVATAGSGIRSFADLAGRRTASMNMVVDRYLVTTYAPKTILIPKPTREGALSAVCRGEADALVSDTRSLQRLMLERPSDCGSLAFHLMPLDLPTYDMGVGASPGNEALAEAFRAAMDDLAVDHSIDKVYAKWLLTTPDEIRHSIGIAKARSNTRLLIAGIGLLLALVILVLAQNMRLRQTRNDLDEAIVRANAASLAKSVFLANMSHEIRTPMNGVLGMADLLLDDHLEPQQKECAAIIRGSAESLLRLINEILDFSKIEAGKFELVAAPFCLRTEADAVMAIFAKEAERKGIALELHWDSSASVMCLADKDRLRQVLVNLVGNAVKFTDEGSVRVQVSACEDGPGLRLRFEVVDTGVGIDEHQFSKLFQPFSQVDGSTTRRFGGTGLGLVISRRLVELMGGEVGYLPNTPRGSRFWFTMQVGLCPPGALAPPVAHHAGDAVSLGLRVLVAEDNKVNQLVARKLLNRLDCSCDIASTGVEAVRLSRESIYDVILMDCHMPEMDGFEATAAIRERDSDAARPPIIAMTASALPEDRARCMLAGMDDYLTKPVTLHELKDTLSRFAKPLAAAPPNSGPECTIAT